MSQISERVSQTSREGVNQPVDTVREKEPTRDERRDIIEAICFVAGPTYETLDDDDKKKSSGETRRQREKHQAPPRYATQPRANPRLYRHSGSKFSAATGSRNALLST